MEAVELAMSSDEEEEKKEEIEGEENFESEFDASLYVDQLRRPSIHHDALMRNNGYYKKVAPILEEEVQGNIIDEEDQELINSDG